MCYCQTFVYSSRDLGLIEVELIFNPVPPYRAYFSVLNYIFTHIIQEVNSFKHFFLVFLFYPQFRSNGSEVHQIE